MTVSFVAQGKYEEALRIYDRSLAIRKRELGPDHPDVVTTLNNIAELLKCKVRETSFTRSGAFSRLDRPLLESVLLFAVRGSETTRVVR